MCTDRRTVNFLRVAGIIYCVTVRLTVTNSLCQSGYGDYASAPKAYAAAALITVTFWSLFPGTVQVVEVCAPTDDFTCLNNSTLFYFQRTSTSRAFIFRAPEPNIERNCSVYVQSAATKRNDTPKLLQITRLRQKGEGLCDLGYCVSISYNKSLVDVCQATSTGELTFWSSVPFFLKLDQTSRLNQTSSMLVHLTTTENAVNLCTLVNASDGVLVDRRLYVFASQHGMRRIPPNDAVCRLGSYSLTMRARKASSSLRVSALAAPPITSCWVLKLNNSLLEIGNNVTSKPGSTITLLYANVNRSESSCSPSVEFSGFTVIADVSEYSLVSGENVSNKCTLEAPVSEFDPSTTPMANMPVATGPPSGDADLLSTTLQVTEHISNDTGTSGTSGKVLSQSESHLLTAAYDVTIVAACSSVAAVVLLLAAMIASVLIVRHNRRRAQLREPPDCGVSTSVARALETSTSPDEISMLENELYSAVGSV